MSEWSADLNTALATGDSERMKMALARVPRKVLQRAVPYLEAMARVSVNEGRLDEAIAYYDQLIDSTPGNIQWHASRADAYLEINQPASALKDARRIEEIDPDHPLGFQLQARAHEALHEATQAIRAYRNALRFLPGDEAIGARIQALETQIAKEELLRRTLAPTEPESAVCANETALTPVSFDPALLDDPSIPASFDAPMVAGLKQLLRRYSAHQSVRNSLEHLTDATWLAAWDDALVATANTTVLLHGSQLGVFALRALEHGASRVLAAESHALDRRICSGIIQKRLLTKWRALHGAEVDSWSEEERSKSFEAFTSNIDIAATDDTELNEARCDYVIFPHIDHTLLGTGIVQAIREYRARGLATHARILPARAKIFARGIQWAYGATPFRLQPMNALRWSIYPQALELPSDAWTALTDALCIGEVDLENFVESIWNIDLPVIESGSLDAIVFWFELDLGRASLSNAPGSELRSIKPAVQHTDNCVLNRGELLRLKVQVLQNRLHFQTEPPLTRQRSHSLPGWYIPMLLDRGRNDAYSSAITRALQVTREQTVLDIGAGCGLLSMMAAQAGAARTTGCEVDAAITAVGHEVIETNGQGHKISLIQKDCRALSVPEDLPQRADLAIFELFDCSLIGEGVLHLLAHAREHLLGKDARYLPKGATIRAQVVEYRLSTIWGIEVNLLNPYLYSPAFINVDARNLDYRPVTEAFDVFTFDFSRSTPTPESKQIVTSAIRRGVAGAVLFWFDLQVDDSTVLSNDPSSPQQFHWKQGLQFLPEIRTEHGADLPLLAAHDGSGLSFRWDPESLPKEALYPLPRFDPRLLAAANELEQQTQALWRHCLSHASERDKVVELAKRFAVDPATHGIDPTIASRFAAMFFRS